MWDGERTGEVEAGRQAGRKEGRKRGREEEREGGDRGKMDIGGRERRGAKANGNAYLFAASMGTGRETGLSLDEEEDDVE